MKKGAAPVQAAAAKAIPAKEADDDSEDEVAPPMMPFEAVDNDVDEDADKKELDAEEAARHDNHGHPGRFVVHKKGEKQGQNVHPKDWVDPMESVHNHRLGSLGEKPSKTKAAPVPAQKPKVAAPKKSHLNSLTDAVGAEEPVVEEPKSKPEPKAVPQNNTAKTENHTEVAVSAETMARLEKLKAQRKAEKNAAKAPKKVVEPPAAPKKPHNLGKDLETVSASDLHLDDKVVAKLKAAMPSPKKVSAPSVPVVHAPEAEHRFGDAIGRLHAHAAEAKASTATRTTTASVAPRQRKATPQQLAAARRASALTDALRNVNASEVKLDLGVSDEAAQRIKAIEAQKKAEADKVEKEIKPKTAPVDHMAELRATAEKELEKKAHHLEAKAAKKAAEKQERPLAKLAEALGEEAATSTTTTAAPAKKADVDPIKALHQRLHQDEPKKVEKPKPAPKPVPQKQTEEEPDEGIMAGFHHNKARDNLPPVLR